MINLARAPRRFRMGQGEAAAAENLKTRGAVLQVRIGVPAAIAASYTSKGQTVPAAKQFLAMIDTGASISAISELAAAQTGLVQTGTVQLGGIGGTGIKAVYGASIGFGDPTIPALDPVQIAAVQLPTNAFDVLIGRDILKNLVLTYDGPRGSFALAPSANAPQNPPGQFVQPAPLPVGANAASLEVGKFPTYLIVGTLAIGALSLLDVF